MLLLLASLALADEPATLQARVERIVAADWQVSGLRAEARLGEQAVRGTVHIDRVMLPAADLDLADIAITCGRLRLAATAIGCEDGRLSAPFPLIGRHSVAATFDYDRRSGDTRFELAALPLAGGAIDLAGMAGEAGLDVRFNSDELELAGLAGLASALGTGLAALETGGRVSVAGRLVSSGGELRLTLDSHLRGASVANAIGTAVADAVDGRLQLEARQTPSGWSLSGNLAADRGEVYIEPVYANLSEHAVQISVADVTTSDFTAWNVGSYRLRQPPLIDLAGRMRVALPAQQGDAVIANGTVEITNTSVNAVYGSLLQVLAAGTLLGELETDGRVSGRIEIAGNALAAARLELDDVVLDDARRRFAIYGLDGRIDWPGPGAEAGQASASRLSWDSATAYSIVLGGAALRFRLGGDDLELLEPLRLPTMGGALELHQFAVHDYGTDGASALLDATLEPIQLGQLTGAFGWPAFSGSLSGRLPLLQYEGNAMTVGGRLTAQAFDGDIVVSNLRLEQPFGRVPRLYGDLQLSNLDLERITSTFSFGLIQGRLSGEVSGLEMHDWQPVAMDMYLYTPPDDKSRHRISQRAVENLASVGGGGAAAALSTGMLKFFEVFAYDRIGLRCILEDGVCAMSGAGSAGDGPFGRGYYIVKGSGLPRIDVIGYRDRVSWQRLVQQLAAITRTEAPVVD
ncbi:MAG: hypothetical protein U5K76_09395 [Woeseiaceae bacterium]|nr:hypothetical protein [Woeseiaceae bacterium]